MQVLEIELSNLQHNLICKEPLKAMWSNSQAQSRANEITANMATFAPALSQYSQNQDFHFI